MKTIRTELSLTREEFDSYNVGVDAEVTFCLKEFRVCVTLQHHLLATAHTIGRFIRPVIMLSLKSTIASRLEHQILLKQQCITTASCLFMAVALAVFC